MMKKKLKLSLLFLSSLLLLAGCSLPGLASTSDDNTVAITGGITSEAQILGSIVADMVEHYTDKKTNVINNLATTTINHQAMLNGDASISAARYTGTDVTTTQGLPAEKDPKKAFNLVQSEFEKRYQQTWFPSYGFENTYVFLVTKETAEKYNLKTVSDLGKVADKLVAVSILRGSHVKATVMKALKRNTTSNLNLFYQCKLAWCTMQSTLEKWTLS